MKKIPPIFLACFFICAISWLVSACDIQISLEAAPQSPAAATATVNAEQSDQIPAIKFSLNGVAQGYTSLAIEAASAGTDLPSWENLPAHTEISLNGYIIQNHLLTAQLIVYPAGELARFNDGAGQQAEELTALLQNKQAGERMPFLPLFNAAQIMHAQVKYLDLANGKGVRFLTQFNQAPMPINNHDLFYTFQGLSNDGKYYLAAILPVNHPSLPVDGMVNQKDMDAYISDFKTKMNKAIASLNLQPANSFSPDLARLDEMIQSIEIK